MWFHSQERQKIVSFKFKTMMNAKQLFLTSTIGGIKKENWYLSSTPISNKNNFFIHLKQNLKWKEKFVMISSNPNDYENNDNILQLDQETLEWSELHFKSYEILDHRNQNRLHQILDQASLIFLAWGNTYLQNTFFEFCNLKVILTQVNCPIIGISAGAMNCWEKVINSSQKSKNPDLPLLLEWLGISKYTIIPHFEKKQKNPEELKLILEASQSTKIYALYDGSYIRNDTVYGKCELIYQGEITKICEDWATLLLEG